MDSSGMAGVGAMGLSTSLGMSLLESSTTSWWLGLSLMGVVTGGEVSGEVVVLGAGMLMGLSGGARSGEAGLDAYEEICGVGSGGMV